MPDINQMSSATIHVYEVRLRKDKRGVDLISDALPFRRLWFGQPNAIDKAIGYAMHYGQSQNAVIRIYDSEGNLIETHDSREVAEYQARLAHERSAAVAQAQAQQKAEAASRAQRIHEVRAEAGRKGAAARWAGHEKVERTSSKHGSRNLEWAPYIIGGVIGVIGEFIRSITRRHRE